MGCVEKMEAEKRDPGNEVASHPSSSVSLSCSPATWTASLKAGIEW